MIRLFMASIVNNIFLQQIRYIQRIQMLYTTLGQIYNPNKLPAAISKNLTQETTDVYNKQLHLRKKFRPEKLEGIL